MTLGHPVPSFYVSFSEKLLKIVATRGEIFSLKFTKYRLAAGLRPDPLGELEPEPATAGSQARQRWVKSPPNHELVLACTGKM